jgi:hypothetical protein
MPDFMNHAAWTLVVAFVLSIAYELYRSTVKRDVSRHDTMRGFTTQLFTIYLAAGVVIALLLTGQMWAAWVGLAFSIIAIFISIFYYNPTIQMERQPGLIDWFEDLVFTGLLFVAAAQLIYAVQGYGVG